MRVSAAGVLLAGLLVIPYPALCQVPAPLPPATFTVYSANFGCAGKDGANSFTANAWWIGTSNAVSNSIGGGATTRTQVRDLRVAKEFDECSAALFAASTTGKHLATVTLSQSDAAGKITMTIVLSEATVSSFELAGDAATVMPRETVSFSYNQITIANRVSGSKACFDVRENKPC